jgi:anti-anti-sigma regulatory factor
MDSSGLKVLATIALARAESGGVLLRNPCRQIRKLLQVAGMSHVVAVEPALEQAAQLAS